MSNGMDQAVAIPFSQPAPLLRQAVEQGRFLLWRLKLSLSALMQPADDKEQIERQVYVIPNKITYDAASVLCRDDLPNTLGGGWDRQVKRFPIDGPLVESFRRHFLSGAKWSETDFYQGLTRRIETGEGVYGLHTRDELAQWLKRWDELVQNVNGGHVSATTQETPDNWPEVPLAIGRDGTLAAVANVPAVAIAMVFGIKQIPCRVVLRHPKWVQFCKEFQCFSQTQHDGQLYQPCTHVELAEMPSSWSEQRFRIIQNCLNGSRGRLMDIGANLGYFCHRAEDMGYDCVAVESCPRLAFFMEKLKQAEKRAFRVICGSFLDYPFNESYDVILALNIFHHFLKKEDRHHKLMAMLGRMRVREMIFQAHKPDEPQMANAYRNYSPDEFVQFILAHSCLKSAEYIGADQDRPIYRLRAA